MVGRVATLLSAGVIHYSMSFNAGQSAAAHRFGESPMVTFAVLLLLQAAPPGPSATKPQVAVPKATGGAPGQPATYRVIATRTGQELALSELADQLATRDIVFFGELHDNVMGHQVYANLAQLLVERRPDTLIAMEMFERDVQGVVNDYLRGRIDEATFLRHSRPWKDYARDYRPLVELARQRQLDVVAGNLPKSVASRTASKDGPGASPFLPRVTTAPRDRYWELFGEAMKNHPGADGAVERMYRAQCAKDDAMAESVADYLAANPHRQPLVIHCNGNFHSDYGLGAATRLAQRVPLAQPAIISMMAAADVAQADWSGQRQKGHYLLIVPAPPAQAVEKSAEPAPKKPGEVQPGKAGSNTESTTPPAPPPPTRPAARPLVPERD
jgi:uncharacterized iron-regulated protein